VKFTVTAVVPFCSWRENCESQIHRR